MKSITPEGQGAGTVIGANSFASSPRRRKFLPALGLLGHWFGHATTFSFAAYFWIVYTVQTRAGCTLSDLAIRLTSGLIGTFFAILTSRANSCFAALAWSLSVSSDSAQMGKAHQ